MSQSAQLHWSSSSATHVGHVRQINEDALLDRTDLRLWAVADGMGGHHAGDIASSSIIRILNETNPKTRLSAYVDEIEERILTINERLRKMALEHEDNRTIGSTVVVMVALDQYCALLWAGDSRAYRLRDGNCAQLTRDHSQVEELIQKGLLLREDAEQHPASNIITRAVGASDDLYVDVDIEEIRSGDTFLLCSDGLYKHITDQEIAEFLKNPNIHEIGHGLVQLTLDRGAIDNVSVVAIRAE
jgi:serine/threonine protein phosphatase PrpC